MMLASEVHGDGPTAIVCLHGFGLNRGAMVAAMEPALGDQPGLRRLYPDLPGAGESPAGPEHSDGVRDAVLDWVDATLGDGQFLLAGHSYGGYLAAAIARQRPRQVAGLLLACPGVKAEIPDRDLPADPPPDWQPAVPDDLRDDLLAGVGNRTPEAAARVAEILVRHSGGDDDYRQRLRATGYRLSDEGTPFTYAGPTSIITGAEDRISGFRDQFAALGSYPAGSFAVLADAGHYVPFEQPSAFRDLTHHWLSRCAEGIGSRA